MIAVTDRSRWALVALAELAGREETCPVPVLEVAERRGIPVHLLEQLFSTLRRAGVLQSQRGVKGGYQLRRDPRELTVLEVVESIDGPLAPARNGDGACDRVWACAAERLAQSLRDVTVADVVEREARAQAAPMFHI
ncbi:MAG: Rrf2 family transcriptional regulator [Thermoleophilia bacterium]|jgi:Rrf2 family protein|nr:Rrf2 family transcriptional regulator [Thermoleophilia bacterium]